MPTTTVYNPGAKGVNVDKDPLLLDDTELQQATNMTHDPTASHSGAMRKRPGLARWNTASAGGPILGGIAMPVLGLGGSPIAQGGGSGLGSGGGGTGGGPAGGNIGSLVGTGIFGAGQQNPSARLIALGRHDSTAPAQGNTVGVGWWVVDSGANQGAQLLKTPGPPSVSGYPQSGISIWPAQRPMAVYNGSLYYVLAQNNVNNIRPIVRVTDGIADRQFITIPRNQYDSTADQNFAGASYSQNQSIFQMTVGNGKIYMTIGDRIVPPSSSANGGQAGRVIGVDPATGAITEINLGTTRAATPAAFANLPFAVIYWSGRLWISTFDQSAGTNQDVAGTVIATSLDFDSGKGYATTDYTLGTKEKFSCFAIYKGYLFAGTISNSATPAYAHAYVRVPSKPVGAAGAWSTAFAASGGTLANLNSFVSAVVFNPTPSDPTAEKLYMSFFNSAEANGATIYQLSANLTSIDSTGSWDGTTTVTSSLVSTGSTDGLMYSLFVDNGILYAFGVDANITRFKMWKTTDGTTWTDITSKFPSTNSSIPIPVFFGFNSQ